MSHYQVLARKYRPQTFSDVLNQEAIIATLKNAIKHKRLAQAYLFCGSRGTGKTTLARILAKALNCQMLTPECEPCNQCTSCKEITSGHSLDVLEIDGASNRGIDDIRQINETVGYAASSGGYKIYIIDEVHMLTKEAFNALLKTLEEPPPKVKFLFATTEAHKVLPTILSRCQRFNLNRISPELIQNKLRKIAVDQKIEVDDEALRLVATSADGGLRDAESLFDQILAFHNGPISAKTVAAMLGIVENDLFFALDQAGAERNLALAFEISDQVFSQGKDLVHFVESLTEHFRNILVLKLAGKQATYLNLTDEEKKKYEASAKLYSQECCLTILDFLVEAQNQIKFSPSPKVTLEALLLRIIRAQSRIPVDILVKRLADVEQQLKEIPAPSSPASIPMSETPSTNKPLPNIVSTPTSTPNSPLSHPTVETQSPSQPVSIIAPLGTISEDPTPTQADLGIKEKKVKTETQKALATPSSTSVTSKETQVEAIPIQSAKQSRYDTVLQFAAIELEGTIQKKSS
ncbi:MAG: DNA polymerase III, subunit gamma and tau [Chlamydiales bacterium 38-26]|nr:DNA polymerase III subunit gamma/tau [Chlamydiales bacterium]OJV07759.1 MAG: DNA polymerase III, subunit gamma and tau [Chlamydiales bacterium 38-26]